MSIRSKFIAIAIALALPLGLWANHVIKVNPDQWQLIGITGYYAVSGEGTAGESADLKNQQVIIDLADANDNISWDANTSARDLNSESATAIAGTAWNDHFVKEQDVSGVTYYNRPSPTGNGNEFLGLPYHSIVGLRTLDVRTLQKAAISFNRPTAPAATNGKDYGASMIAMYVVSPLSSGEPDTMIVFAGNLINRTFKITFKAGKGDKWTFSGDDRDKVYQGKFSYSATYDNPLKLGAGLTEILPGSDTAGSQSGYKSFANTINLEANTTIAEKYSAITNNNFHALEGNFTAYQYDAAESLWKIATIKDAKGGRGAQALLDRTRDINESGSKDSDNKVQNSVTGDFKRWTKGYGYWVRIWDDGNAGNTHSKAPDGQVGILANDQIDGSGDYNGLVRAGWNLLAFPDGVLRYTASGFEIPSGTSVNVFSPFGDQNVTFSGGCTQFNLAVATNNRSVGKANALEVTCLNNTANTSHYLISSKPFYIAGVSNPTGSNIKSLAGYEYAHADLISVGGTIDALRTRLGEYALLVEHNGDYNATSATYGAPDARGLGIGAASWFGVDPAEANASDISNVDSKFTGLLKDNSAIPVPSYDAAKRARAVLLDSNGTNTKQSNSDSPNPLILLAANNRFYVRDNIAVRLFNAEDVNGSTLSIDYDGGSYTTGDIDWIALDNTKDCVLLRNRVAAAQTDVRAFCSNDANKTVVFVSDSQRNFDVKEINVSSQLLVDRYITSAEENASAYGAIKRVIQPSQLYGAFSVADDGFNYGGLANLTYTSVWAEDFPNNGALYYLADNGFKPEMILTGVTSDGNNSSNAAGTISWKALDLTRDPKAWFDSANDFELFWTEKERGYWVYTESGYTNPVSVSGVNLNDTSVVTKHFNNKDSKPSNEIGVFNWLDGYISASVGGLSRPVYTSGESYTVRARLDSEYIPLATTGAVSGSAADFTAYLNDFEVQSLRPNGLKDLNVTATDGLGGRAQSGVQLRYVQPATPVVSISGFDLNVSSNEYATNVLLFQGDVSDENNGADQRIYDGTLTAGVGVVNLSSVTIEYPDAGDINSTRHVIPSYSLNNNDSMVVDLRVVAATAPATNSLSVYSNMRKVLYVPAYSDTFHLYAAGEANVTTHTAAYGNALAGYETNTSEDVAFRGANGKNLTLIYRPINPNQGLAANSPTHVDVQLGIGGPIAQIQYLKKYEGQYFYVYDHSNNSWYYGIFPGDDNDGLWGASLYDLRLGTIPNGQTLQ
ncbi:MAG: hypothetical protein LBP89_01370 [Helicobacteraceae bacterium]|jgi:hypothetical protein|nr:hypothetical protein [Helicobacteraceae bacterium]